MAIIPVMTAGSFKMGEMLSRPAWAKVKPYFPNNQKTNCYHHGSSDRPPAYQACSPEFKLQYDQKKKSL
jgi:hypothetical protein